MPVFALLVLMLLLPLANANANPAAATDGQLEMSVFWGISCPHCDNQKPFLDTLEQRYPALTIQRYEVSRSSAHHHLFGEMAREHQIRAGSVPTLFVAGRAWIGDSPTMRAEIVATIEQWLRDAEAARQIPPAPLEPSPPTGEDTQAESPPRPPPAMATESTATSPGQSVSLPLFGEVNLALQPLLLSTALIALVDGFNPCSLWVLTLLLGLVLHSGSRGRIALVGITFLTTTALIYGAFIAGIFSVLSYVLYLNWVQWLVAAFALLFGVVNIKDYFWCKSGLSFTIADSHKPGIYKSIRGLLDQRLGGLGLMLATIIMASGIALVELPCTAGFPVVWSGIIAEHNVTGLAFVGLLALYLLIYLAIELVVFATALFTLRMKRLEEGHGRVLKLIGGAVMVALALVLVLDPELMNDVGGTLLVFVGAILASLLVMLLHRLMQAR